MKMNNYCENKEVMKKVFVTPAMAKEWLSTNTNNRKLIAHHVAHLEQVLISGQWRINGDAIRFGKDGVLQDGQHRLTACVNTGIGFPTFVVWNLEAEAFDTIDVNVRPRQVSDVIGIHGIKNASGVAASVKTLWAFRHSGLFFDGTPSFGYTPHVCMEIIRKRPDLFETISRVHRNHKKGNAFSSKGLFGALYYLFRTAEEKLSDEMFDVVQNGTPEIDRPFNLLRETLMKRRILGVRVGNKAQASLAIKAWNSEITGQWVRQLRHSQSEAYPTIKGIDYEKLDEII